MGQDGLALTVENDISASPRTTRLRHIDHQRSLCTFLAVKPCFRFWDVWKHLSWSGLTCRPRQTIENIECVWYEEVKIARGLSLLELYLGSKHGNGIKRHLVKMDVEKLKYLYEQVLPSCNSGPTFGASGLRWLCVTASGLRNFIWTPEGPF